MNSWYAHTLVFYCYFKNVIDFEIQCFGYKKLKYFEEKTLKTIFITLNKKILNKRRKRKYKNPIIFSFKIMYYVNV